MASGDRGGLIGKLTANSCGWPTVIVTMPPVLLELYGTDADRAGEQCILTAAAEGRDENHRFWLAVAASLRSAQRSKDIQLERRS